jgi:CHAT domain-containing protein
LRKDYKAPVFIELDSKETIDKLIKQISLSFNKGAKINAEKWFDSSKQLYNSLWGKLDGHIKEGDNIYFSLDGLLYKAPIELLSDKNGKIVNEKFNLFRLSSTREICMKRRDEISKVVLYGGMFYDANPKGLEVDSLVAFKGYNDESARSGWSYLPASATEVDSISSLLSTSGVSVVEKKGLNGTEESFRELSGSDFSIVHIATHGFYFPQKEVSYLDYFQSKVYISPMIRSGLMMTGGQAAWMGKKNIDPDHDGILTSEEISRLDLSDVSMVVLSACQTGLGDIDNGAEGVIGIQRAFKLAGVQSLLMSLWKVDDNATSYMMQRFYSRMVSGDTKHNAFKTAQQEVRKKYPNPYYWAGFILLD